MNWGMQELVTIMMLLYSILDMYGKQVRIIKALHSPVNGIKCVLHTDAVCTEWISFCVFELSELSPFI